VQYVRFEKRVTAVTFNEGFGAVSCDARPQGVAMNSFKARWILGLAACATIAGCATTNAVTPVGQDAYHVNVIGARYETQTDANLKALNIAHQYCDQQGKHVMFRASTESSEHAWSPKQEDLTFVCMDAKDPGFMRAATERATPVIAQQE
jgi:hypothetical protein